tara:strand:- start:1201 stop:2523 length:1323 start_codon:yes stop_codon:yes gene_type:complete
MALLRTGPTRTQLMDALEKARRRPTTPVTGGLGEAMARMATQWVDAFSDRDTANRQVSEREAKNNAISRILQQAMMAGAGPVGRVTDATQVQAMPEYAGQSLANAMSSPQAQQTNQINFDGGQPINTDFGSPLAVGPTRQQILASNPATAELAFQMQMQQEEADRKLQQQIQLAEAKVRPTENEKQAKILQAEFGLTPNEAFAVANGFVDIQPGTAPNEFILASKIPGFKINPTIRNMPVPLSPDETNVVPPPNMTKGQSPREPSTKEVDITGDIDIIEEGTGPFDFLASIMERVPFLSELVDGTDERKAAMVLSTLSKDFQRAFANNPRFAIGEMQQIIDTINPATGAISTGSALISDLLAVRGVVGKRVADAKKTSSDPNLQKKIREDDQSIVNNGLSFLHSVDQILSSSVTIPTAIDKTGKRIMYIEGEWLDMYGAR